METTGLAPKQEKIIEIGAVRVREGQIVGSFTSFVNPGRILPAHITELTGILQEQVDEAETMESVLPGFLEFAGDLALVGHRILIDYGFLKRSAVFLLIPTWIVRKSTPSFACISAICSHSSDVISRSGLW